MKFEGDIDSEGYVKCSADDKDITFARKLLEKNGWDALFALQLLVDKKPDIPARELVYGWINLFYHLVREHHTHEKSA